ncbi:hypothetical protein GCM10009727_39290 [Actinomadura napierensis]|uniref:IS30 family transposase n=1 Tax=Actinomadura napierensis TaxID=267854 RepID=A0ABN2ZFT9_9ACTN
MFVTDQLMISQRPAEADDRAVPWHWEGALIIGLNRSAIGTLVERTTRYTMLLRLPPMDGHGAERRTKNGPLLAGHGVQAVREAIADTLTTWSERLRRSLTWDQGSEMAQHAQLRLDTGAVVNFADPHSPWQRGTNEYTNGLLRQSFPWAPTWAGTPRMSWTPSSPRSTVALAKHWDGTLPPKPSGSIYAHRKAVLRRLLAPGQGQRAIEPPGRPDGDQHRWCCTGDRHHPEPIPRGCRGDRDPWARLLGFA